MKKLTKSLCLCLAIVIVAGLVPYRALAKESVTETSEVVTEKSVVEKDELAKQHMPPVVAGVLWAVAKWVAGAFLTMTAREACQHTKDFIWTEWHKGEWYSWAYATLFGFCKLVGGV